MKTIALTIASVGIALLPLIAHGEPVAQPIPRYCYSAIDAEGHVLARTCLYQRAVAAEVL